MTNVLIVTGGSRGIGAATARLAAEQGYAICITYRRQQAAANSIVQSIQQMGNLAIAVATNMASEADILRLFETVDQKLGPVTALVNNAGILEPQMRLVDMEAARLSRIFQANVIGSFLCAREAVKRMSTQHGGPGGAIVNVSSVAARLGSPGEYVDYAASKGAIDTMTIGLAQEVANEGIRVNAVRPGYIYTDIHADGGEANRVDRIKEFVPMKRGGQAIEVANAILWLLSPQASYTTGSFIEIAGGR
ncbi:MAG: SDR family oxidoreductase [Cyanobacteria bacterium J06638_28]